MRVSACRQLSTASTEFEYTARVLFVSMCVPLRPSANGCNDAWGRVGWGGAGEQGSSRGEETCLSSRASRSRSTRTSVAGRATGGRREGRRKARVRPGSAPKEEKQTREAITYADERWDRQRAGDGETGFVRRGSWKKRRGARARATYVFRLAAGACVRNIQSRVRSRAQ